MCTLPVNQLDFTPDQSCYVNVSVPTAPSPTDPPTCTSTVDAGAGRRIGDTSSCPNLELIATAATTRTDCKLEVNGLNLMDGCGLHRLISSNDGVCALAISPPALPRASCFNTKTQGDGAEKLASWIRGLADGTPVRTSAAPRHHCAASPLHPHPRGQPPSPAFPRLPLPSLALPRPAAFHRLRR